MQPWRRPETSALLGEEGAGEDEGVSVGCVGSEGRGGEGSEVIFVRGMECGMKRSEKFIVVVYRGIMLGRLV